MRLLGYLLALLLGLAAGVAAVALCRTVPGLVLGSGTALVVIWALRQWRARTATWFAGGWLVPLVVALRGRDEGDYAVANDLHGYAFMVVGFVVMGLGVVSLAAHDAGSRGRPA